MTWGHPGGSGDPFGGNPFGGQPYGGTPGMPAAAPAPPREVNTLATLSVVFAVVFAPVGAVLGHLGLAQIARTGQRGRNRALVGVTLSYVFISVAVVSLVVWMTIGGTPDASTVGASPSNTPPATTAVSTTTMPTASSAPLPVLPGPTLTVVDPPGPLLNLDEVKAVLGTPVNQYAPVPVPVPDLAAYAPIDAVETPPRTQGSVSDTECAAMVFAGTAAAYQDTGYRAFHQVTMAQPGPGATQSVTQTAAVFDSAAAANDALARYLLAFDPCKGRTVTLTVAGTGTSYTVELGSAPGEQRMFTGAKEYGVYLFQV
jgi:hypothetical protein